METSTNAQPSQWLKLVRYFTSFINCSTIILLATNVMHVEAEEFKNTSDLKRISAESNAARSDLSPIVISAEEGTIPAHNINNYVHPHEEYLVMWAEVSKVLLILILVISIVSILVLSQALYFMITRMIVSEEQLNEVKRLLEEKNPGQVGKDLAEGADKHIPEMKKPEDAKSTKLKTRIVKTSALCPICCYSADNNFARHLTDAHFPSYQTDPNQKQLREELEIALARNPKLVDEWNNELKAFWNYLLDKNCEISSDVDYVQCTQFIDQAKSKTGDAVVYTQVQDTSAQFYCEKDSLTGIHHYVGKRSCRGFRYLIPNNLIMGRVGYEFKAAIESRIPIYFFIAFENLSKESAEIFEHCVMLALFHLDYKFKNAQGLSNVWNISVSPLPKNHDLCTTDPKILIKIGLVLLHEILHKFKASVHDKSFFESKEVLAHYDNLDEASQKQFVEQCGTFEPRDDGDNKRSSKRRKIDKTSLNSGDAGQLEMTLQMAQYLISARDSGKTMEELFAKAEDVINQFRS